MFSLEPHFFDIFGFFGFAYIIIFALLSLSGKILPKWTIVLLFLIGVVGLVVDGLVVYTFYLR